MAIESPERTGSAFKKFEIKPQLLKSGKTSSRLAGTDILSCGVQVVASGGETNLHAHNAQDAIWLVLDGKAKFYTTGDEVVAELGKHEALLIPKGELYWFESASEENLVILRIAATDKNSPNTRTDAGERVFAVGDAEGGIKRQVEYQDKRFGE